MRTRSVAARTHAREHRRLRGRRGPGFEPDGEASTLLRIEKRNANTEWVAQQWPDSRVSRRGSGLFRAEDRHAVTRQTFSVQLPGRQEPDWESMQIEGVRVLSSGRHSRKLKRGAHKSNQFRICLRDLHGSRAEAETRIEQVARLGVPNYFGEQRFGRNGENLHLARTLFAGRRMSRSQRGFALSAARSFLFNSVLDRRVAAGDWNGALDGDVWMLAGTHSIFGPQPRDDDLQARLAAFDIDPTGPLWGKGNLRSGGQVAVIEAEVAMAQPDLANGLVEAELSQERRSLRLRVQQLQQSWAEDDALVLEFTLVSGAFATAVLREICDFS